MDRNTGTTRPVHIKSGITQGSILGPKLVLMFLNDLHSFMKPATVTTAQMMRRFIHMEVHQM